MTQNLFFLDNDELKDGYLEGSVNLNFDEEGISKEG